ncbi:MAG: DUF6519 domain-containing protein, partial [Candidatus Poribacteria bacterium]
MSTEDISRIAFNSRKHYSSVHMQQGRVIVDDDWNESERIENEDLRRSRVEIVGAYGSPNQGFRISNNRGNSQHPRITDIDGHKVIEFDILPGSFYLGGLRLEMEATEQDVIIYETYNNQRDWLQKPHLLNIEPDKERFDLVYLEAWQQPVVAVEDNELLEVALGGPDTSTRIRNMRRVHVEEDVGTPDCARAWQALITKWNTEKKGMLNKENERVPDVKLKVSFDNDGDSEDLCEPPVVGGYLGAENQAIRVQLVNENSFTWGFDNASPLYRVQVENSGKTIRLITDPKDQEHWPLSGQIVEILPWSAVLPNGEKIAEIQGHLSRIDGSYNSDEKTITLITPPLPTDFGKEWAWRTDHAKLGESEEYFFMRVWNRGSDRSSDPNISFTPGTPVTLGKTGLQITFTGTDFVAGDYWVIAVRPETSDKVVPWELEIGLPPHGIHRFYAPLAIIHWTVADGVEGYVIRDCRRTFRPLTDLDFCCTYTVGDGIHSHGDFDSIEEAVENLPSDGGKICILRGEHFANVRIRNRRDIHITGCGGNPIVRPHSDYDNIASPIFDIDSSQNIKIDYITMMAENGTAVKIEDDAEKKLASVGITIAHNRIIAYRHAIEIDVEDMPDENNIWIAYNEIAMLDKPNGGAAILSNADSVLIERNKIVVVPAPNTDDPYDGRHPHGPTVVIFDPCAEPDDSYKSDFDVHIFVAETYAYLKANPKSRKVNYQAEGGIQIDGGSDKVKIIDNEIFGGRGNGINLGYLAIIEELFGRNFGIIQKLSDNDRASLKKSREVIYELTIEGNNIQNMGLSGIGVTAFSDLKSVGFIITVEDL